MELFNKKFVHFMWDDELQGKKCFVADNIGALKAFVETCRSSMLFEVDKGDGDYPFIVNWTDDSLSARYRFAYSDPNYDAKRAFNEGKKIQVYDTAADDWGDCDEPIWCDDCMYRVKPEEKKWIVYLARQGDEHCYLTACTEDNWEDIQKNRNVKTKLFVGTEHEAEEWYESREKFTEIIKAWEDGKELQFRPRDPHLSWQECGNPSWDVDLEYRVKPEEKTVVAKRCSGCVHEHCSATKEPCVSCKPSDSKYEAKLCETCEYLGYSDDSEPCSSCSDEDGYPNWKPVKEEKKWRPYESSAEMIVDFNDRFKANCPPYCEPLVWVKDKQLDCRYLITAFMPHDVEIGGLMYKFEQLLDNFTYLDGSPVGMEVK